MAEDTSETADLNSLKEVPKREEEPESPAIVIVPTEDGAEVRISVPHQRDAVTEVDTATPTSTAPPADTDLPNSTLKVEAPDGEAPDSHIPNTEAPVTEAQTTAVPESEPPVAELVDGDETEYEDAGEQDEQEEDAEDEWQPTPRKRGRQPSNDLTVFVTAVLPETSSCMNLKSSYAEHGLGIPPLELKGASRVRSKLPLTWAAGDLEAYIREQFPVLREYELLRTGPAKSLVLLPPEANTPALLRHEIGRSGLYIRPKGTLADMGFTEPVVVKSPTKRKPVTSPGEKRKRGRPATQAFGVNMLAIPSDVASLASIDYDLLKQQGLGVPDGEISGPFQEKTQLPLKWNSSELDEFIRRSFPRLKKYELLRATPGRHIEKLPRKVNTPSMLKTHLGRQVLCIRAVGPLHPLPKRRHTKTSSYPQAKIQATSENVDKLKTLLRDNFQSVLGSTIEYRDQLSVKASISLIVDRHNTLNFSVSHSWSSEEVLSAGREGPEALLEAEPLWIKNEPAASLSTGAGPVLETGDTTEEDADDGGQDSDATINEDDDLGDGTKDETAGTADRVSPVDEDMTDKADPDFMPLSLPVKRGRGRPRKDGSTGPPGPKRTYTPRGGRKNRVPGERKVYQRKKMEEHKEEPWDAEKVEAYLSQAQRKLTRERVEKYGDIFRNALKAVKTQELTVRAAATKYNIPYGILWEEVNHSRFQCWYCKKNFASSCQLRRHATSHLEVFDHPCAQCPKTFKCIENLRRHLKVHQSTRPYVCDRCGQAFITKESFTRHELKHDNVRNYTCVVCSRQFLTKGELQGHARIHTGRKDFVCATCGQQFARRTSLNKHTTYVHNTECKHTCGKCGKGFKMKYGLDRHMLLHTGENRYNCEVCGQGFKWHASRKLHMKKHLGDKGAPGSRPLQQLPAHLPQPPTLPPQHLQQQQQQQQQLQEQLQQQLQHHHHQQLSPPPPHPLVVQPEHQLHHHPLPQHHPLSPPSQHHPLSPPPQHHSLSPPPQHHPLSPPPLAEGPPRQAPTLIIPGVPPGPGTSMSPDGMVVQRTHTTETDISAMAQAIALYTQHSMSHQSLSGSGAQPPSSHNSYSQ